MVKEIQYTSIKRVLDNLLEHPLLRDVSLEQAVRYTIRFIGLHSFPKMFQDKIATVEIKDFRGLLPCDLVSIIQVKDTATGICLRGMFDSFPRGMEDRKDSKDGFNSVDSNGEVRKKKDWYIPPQHRMVEEPSFKTQGRVIYTSFPEGCVEIAYKSIPVDEDGFPLLIDNENYLAALEAFIKLQVFTIKFDTGKINANVLQNAQMDYGWRSAQLTSEFMTPSFSEAEALARFANTLIVDMHTFDKGMRHFGDREYLRRH